jgi:hypothetical protein
VHLHPQPTASEYLVYPGFVHQTGTQYASLYDGRDQLAVSIVFALDQQEELRLLAGRPVEERMPVFGAVSAGAQVNLYCAAYVGSEIVSLAHRKHIATLLN